MYNVFRFEKHGGGVAPYIRKDLNAKQIENLSCAIEGVVKTLTIVVNVKKGKNIIISCFYRTPGSELETFTKYIEDIWKK